MVTARALLFVPTIYLVCVASGRSLRLSTSDWLHCVGLGALMSLMFYGNVGSVEFISVGLAALLFFTFPPIIAVIQAVVLREPPGVAKSVSLVVAFTGLVLMLGVSLRAADPTGIVMALGAGIAAAWNSVWLVRKLAHLDGVVVTWHMGVVATVILTTTTLATGSVDLPDVTSGWLGLVGVAVLQTVALPVYFSAMQRVGALKCAMVTNVQPVVSIVAAFFFFGELLTPTQLAGGAMVLGGVWLMQWFDHPRRRKIRLV